MENWFEFEQADPRMAQFGRELITKYGMAYLSTIRSDGGPRVHPVSPVIISGKFILTIIPTTPKLADLRRDRRYMLHSLPGPNNAEFSIRGEAKEIADEAEKESLLKLTTQESIVTAIDDVIFELLVQRADFATYENIGTPNMHAIRRTWLSNK